MTNGKLPSKGNTAKQLSKLHLPALKVVGYRSLEDLDVKHLTRVNLITGRNNVGKSSLLEAVHLLASQGSDRSFMDVMVPRGQFSGFKTNTFGLGALLPQRREVATALAQSMFLKSYDAQHIPWRGFVISIPETPRWLLVRFGWYRENIAPDGQQRTREFLTDSSDDAGLALEIAFGNLPGSIVSLAPSALERENLEEYYRLDAASTVGATVTAPQNEQGKGKSQSATPSRYLPPNGLDSVLIAQLWNDIVLSPAEELVVKALRLIDKRVVRCALVGTEKPSPHVLLQGMDHPLPLSAMGDGMTRLFNLALVLASARGGIVAIDEIDTGLHYSVLPQMWDFIFEIAQELDVQVFATTHGKDCVEGFEQALAGCEPALGQVIKLFRSKANPNRIEAACFGADRLATALSSDLEVR